MSFVGSSARVVKPFDGQNFSNWKLRMELFLDEQGVLDCVKGEPNPGNSKWLKNDKKCKSLIAQYLEDAYLEQVRKHQHAYEIWESLCDNYEKKGPCSKRILLKQIMEMKYELKNTIESHFTAFENMMQQLKDAGSGLDESDYCCMLLNTLPSQFDLVVTALETYQEHMSLDDIKRRLKEFEVKIKSSTKLREEEDENKIMNLHAFSAAKGNDSSIIQGKDKKFKNEFKCNFCGRVGHMKKDCFYFKRSTSQQANVMYNKEQNVDESDDASTEFLFITEVGGKSDRKNNGVCWYLDSGASNHYINSEEYLSQSVVLPQQISIKIANTDTMISSKVGTFVGKDRLTGNKCIFNDVYLVPDLRYNLLSVRAITAKGYQVKFYESVVQICKEGRTVATGVLDENLYRLDFTPLRLEGKSAYACEIKPNAKSWDRRLGHISKNGLNRLLNRRNAIFDETKTCPNCIKREYEVKKGSVNNNHEESEVLMQEKELEKEEKLEIRPSWKTKKPAWMNDYEVNLCLQSDIKYEDLKLELEVGKKKKTNNPYKASRKRVSTTKFR